MRIAAGFRFVPRRTKKVRINTFVGDAIIIIGPVVLMA